MRRGSALRSGVYKIECVTNGRTYIGGAVNISRRWIRHRWELRKGIHKNPHLQAAWCKHGEDNFRFSTVLLCGRHNVRLYEQACLDKLPHHFNISLCSKSAMQGRRHSEESKRKTALSLMGHAVSEITRKRISVAGVGRTLSPETIARQSLARRGVRHSAAWIAAIREAHRKYRLLDDDQVREALSLVREGETQTRVAESFGVRYDYIARLVARHAPELQRWKRSTIAAERGITL